MVKKFFCRNGETILVSVFFIVASLLLYFKNIDVQIFIGFVAPIIAVYFGLLKQKIEDDKMFKELFESFNSKYDGEFNDVLNELRRSPEKKIDEIKKNGENLVIDYFNLCAEEYLWFSKGRIPEKIWKAWKNGIIENLKIEQVRAIYIKEMKSSSESYYGLGKELNI